MDNKTAIATTPNQGDISTKIGDMAIEYSTGVMDLLDVRAILAENTINSDVTDLAMTLVDLTERGRIVWSLKDDTYITRVQFKLLKDPVDFELFIEDGYPSSSIILVASQEESTNQVAWCYYLRPRPRQRRVA